MKGFENGIFKELSGIAIPVTSISVNRGYGAFEFFEVISNKPFYGERHLARFRHTLQALKLKTPFDGNLPGIIKELTDLTGLPDFYIKMYAFPHEAIRDGYYDASLYVFPVLMPVYDASLYENGATLLLKNYQRFMPGAKSTNYLAGQYWNDESGGGKVADVLFHNDGYIREASRGNIFGVYNGRVKTPGKNILKGITRSIVLDILTGMDIPFDETDIPKSELFNADEIFLTSTTKLVLPVTRIDSRVAGSGKPGEITRKVMEAFRAVKDEFRNQ